MDSTIAEEIKDLVAEITEVPHERLLSDADFFKDLNIDSLKVIEIVAAFEKKYRVIIPEQVIPNIRTLKQIIDYTKHLNIK